MTDAPSRPEWRERLEAGVAKFGAQSAGFHLSEKQAQAMAGDMSIGLAEIDRLTQERDAANERATVAEQRCQQFDDLNGQVAIVIENLTGTIDDLRAQLATLRQEAETARPVMEAARAYREAVKAVPKKGFNHPALMASRALLDAARALPPASQDGGGA